MLPERREAGNLHYYLFMNSLDEIKLKNKKAGTTSSGKKIMGKVKTTCMLQSLY